MCNNRKSIRFAFYLAIGTKGGKKKRGIGKEKGRERSIKMSLTPAQGSVCPD